MDALMRKEGHHRAFPSAGAILYVTCRPILVLESNEWNRAEWQE